MHTSTSKYGDTQVTRRSDLRKCVSTGSGGLMLPDGREAVPGPQWTIQPEGAIGPGGDTQAFARGRTVVVLPVVRGL